MAFVAVQCSAHILVGEPASTASIK